LKKGTIQHKKAWPGWKRPDWV